MLPFDGLIQVLLNANLQRAACVHEILPNSVANAVGVIICHI